MNIIFPEKHFVDGGVDELRGERRVDDAVEVAVDAFSFAERNVDIESAT